MRCEPPLMNPYARRPGVAHNSWIPSKACNVKIFLIDRGLSRHRRADAWSARRLALCENCVTDGGVRRRFSGPKGLDFLLFGLLLRRAVAKADFALFRFETENLEVVALTLRQHGCDAVGARNFLLLF